MAVFHYLHLRAFAHETEDADRVRQALRHAAQSEDAPLTETRVDGSHKNRILILECEIKKTASVRRVFQALREQDPEGFARMEEELGRRLDEEQNFYLRLDKQQAYLGRVALAEGDDAITLRGKIRSFESKRSGNQQEDARQKISEFLKGLGPRAGSFGQ